MLPQGSRFALKKKKNEDAIAVDAADMYFTVTFLNV